MHDAAERPLRELLIDPQPRRDVELPPMVSAPDSQGVATVKTPEPKPRDVQNMFARLDFGNRQQA
jgi:hypothetical protein